MERSQFIRDNTPGLLALAYLYCKHMLNCMQYSNLRPFSNYAKDIRPFLFQFQVNSKMNCNYI